MSLWFACVCKVCEEEFSVPYYTSTENERRYCKHCLKIIQQNRHKKRERFANRMSTPNRNSVIRYAVRLKNGGYMIQDVVPEEFKIKVRSTDLAIDADLLKDKEVAGRVIEDIIEGKCNIPVEYNKNNPPVEVIEIIISVEE